MSVHSLNYKPVCKCGNKDRSKFEVVTKGVAKKFGTPANPRSTAARWIGYKCMKCGAVITDDPA